MATNKTATQQITQQTNNPITIARAVYLDAVRTYNGLGQRYANYHHIVRKSNPELADKVVEKLTETSRMLNEWGKFSKMGITKVESQKDFDSFRIFMLEVLVELETK